MLPVLLAVSLAQSAAFSVQFDLLLGRADTRILAAEWIEANTPPGEDVGVEVHSLLENPWGWGPNSTTLRAPFWARNTPVFRPDQEDGLRKVVGGEFPYVVTTSWGLELLRADPVPPPERLETYANLARWLTPRARFGPGPSGADVEFAVDDMYAPFWHLFDRERPGPTATIYQRR